MTDKTQPTDAVAQPATDRETHFYLAGWNGARGNEDSHEHFRQALQAAPPAPAAVAVPPLTPDEARRAARTADLMRGPSDTTQPGAYAMAGASALAAKIAAAPAQASLVPSFANGVLHSTVLHKLWEESEPTAQRGQPGALAWQLGVFAGKVAQAASAPAQEHATQLAGQRQFQQRVQPWLLQCFGADIAGDKAERNHRFLEEALELVQSCSCTASEAHQLVDYVFGRPVGEPAQEVGGVMVTLAALCYANGLDMHTAGETELERISVPAMMAKIKAKQAAKPKHSPLPAAPAQAQEDARDGLTPAELDQLDRAIEHFVEGEDTDVDWRLLTRAACLGFLECERFTVPPTARAAIDAARAAQGGA